MPGPPGGITPVPIGGGGLITVPGAPPMEAVIGEVKREIRKHLGLDLTAISGATVTYEVKTPSGATKSWTCTVLDSKHGHVTYQTSSGDLDEVGLWVIRPKISAAGVTLYHKAFGLLVKEVHDM